MNSKSIIKQIQFLISSIAIFLLLSQCGIYKKTDARKIPTNSKERVEKNMEEGRRIKFGNLTSRGSGNFEFASSNELWRATIDILDFVPLSNVDYGGGIIITDWYNSSDKNNSSIKIMVQFLSNEIRSDGMKITVYNKSCKNIGGIPNCSTSENNGEIAQELKLAILKKAATLKIATTEKEKKQFRKDRKGIPKVIK